MKNAPVGHIAGANFFRMADYNMCVLIIGQVTLPAHKKKKISWSKVATRNECVMMKLSNVANIEATDVKARDVSFLKK